MSTTNTEQPQINKEILRPIKKQILRDKICEIIREWILSGRLRPGERLVEYAIARQLEVSRAPLREALWLLAHQGLVVIEAHKGAFVTKLTEQDLREIFELREALEIRAALNTRRSITPRSEKLLEAATVALEKASLKQDMAAFVKADARFHEVVASLSGNKRLEEILNDLSTRFFGYELIRDLPIAEKFRFEDMAKVHRHLKELLVSGSESEITRAFEEAYATFLKDVLKRFAHDE